MSLAEKVPTPVPDSIVSETWISLLQLKECAQAPSETFSILPVSGKLLSVILRGDEDVCCSVLQTLPVVTPKEGEGLRFRAVFAERPFGGTVAMRPNKLRYVSTVKNIHVFALEAASFGLI